MTLHVVQFPTTSPGCDIATEARSFVDAIEDGAFGHVESVLVLIGGSSLSLSSWGGQITQESAVCTLEMAKAHIIGRMIGR